MHLLFDDVLRPNQYLLSVSGVWPMPPNAGVAFKFSVLIRIILALICLTGILLPQMFTVKIHWGNIDIMADTGCLALVYALLVFKLCYIVVHQRTFIAIYQHLREFWDISNDDRERKSYEDYALMAKFVTIVGFISGVGNMTSFLSAALIPLMFHRHQDNYTRPLPFDLSYGFNSHESPKFEMVFISQALALLYGLCCAVGGDCTIMAVVLHVSGQFRFIGARFQTIGRDVEDAIYCNNDKAKIKMTKMISACIAHHQLVIRVAKKVNDLLSPIVFGQMLTSGIQICLTGYAVMEGNNTGIDVIKFAVFLFSVIVQLFIWCWPGECLIEESNAVADSIWHDVVWFLLPAKQQRDLCFIILRAQKECNIATAFQVMSIQKLAEVLKAAGSYMAMLRTLKEK